MTHSMVLCSVACRAVVLSISSCVSVTPSSSMTSSHSSNCESMFMCLSRMDVSGMSGMIVQSIALGDLFAIIPDSAIFWRKSAVRPVGMKINTCTLIKSYEKPTVFCLTPPFIQLPPLLLHLRQRQDLWALEFAWARVVSRRWGCEFSFRTGEFERHVGVCVWRRKAGGITSRKNALALDPIDASGLRLHDPRTRCITIIGRIWVTNMLCTMY